MEVAEDSPHLVNLQNFILSSGTPDPIADAGRTTKSSVDAICDSQAKGTFGRGD